MKHFFLFLLILLNINIKLVAQIAQADSIFSQVDGKYVACDDYNRGEIILVPEKFPIFPGGEKELAIYIKTFMRNCNTSGTSFIVDIDGSIKCIKPASGLSPNCEKRVITSLRNMPAWTPAMRRDSAVAVQYFIGK